LCEGLFGVFFPLVFHCHINFFVAVLRLNVNCLVLPQVARDVAVRWVPARGRKLASVGVDDLPRSARVPPVFLSSVVVNTGMFLRWLNAVFTSSWVIFCEKYLSINEKYPFCWQAGGRAQLFAGTGTVQVTNRSWWNSTPFLPPEPFHLMSFFPAEPFVDLRFLSWFHVLDRCYSP